MKRHQHLDARTDDHKRAVKSRYIRFTNVLYLLDLISTYAAFERAYVVLIDVLFAEEDT